MGKSILLRYLVSCCNGAQVEGAAASVYYTIAEYLEVNRKGPRIVCMDLARATGEIDWTMVEKVKGGRFLSPKYRPRLVKRARPRFLV